MKQLAAVSMIYNDTTFGSNLGIQCNVRAIFVYTYMRLPYVPQLLHGQ